MSYTSFVSGASHFPVRPGIGSTPLDPDGMSELHEQAITTIASTKDKRVINT